LTGRLDNSFLSLFSQLLLDLFEEGWEEVIGQHSHDNSFSENIPQLSFSM